MIDNSIFGSVNDAERNLSHRNLLSVKRIEQKNQVFSNTEMSLKEGC